MHRVNVPQPSEDLSLRVTSQLFFDLEEFILNLPMEIQYHIVRLCGSKGCVALSQVNKYFNSIANCNTVWRSIVEEELFTEKSETLFSLCHESINFKQYFFEKVAFESLGQFSWKPCTKIVGDLPPPAHCHSASPILDPSTKKMKFLFIGGQTRTERSDEVHEFEPETRKFTKVEWKGQWNKIARHVAVSDLHRIYVVGGYDGVSKWHEFSYFDFQTKAWHSPAVSGTKPPNRSNATGCLIGRHLYYHGGTTTCVKTTPQGTTKECYQSLGDLYRLNLDTFEWSEIQQKGQIPSVRSGHRFIPIGKKILCFGGGLWDEVWHEKYNDLFVFDTETNTWTKESRPQVNIPNTSTFSTPFTIGYFVFFFGGAEVLIDRNYVHNQTYMLDTVTMTWHKPDFGKVLPAARDMSCAVVHDKSVFLFGGFAGSILGDFSELVLKNRPRLTNDHDVGISSK